MKNFKSFCSLGFLLLALSFLHVNTVNAQIIVSDDFCDSTLNPVWTFTDPAGDGSYVLSGSGTNDSFLEISVPSGLTHQIYNGINAPNMMQSVNDTDFEVEVKFESSLGAPQIPMQGVLVKESDTKYLRFEFYGLNNATKAYVQAFNPNAQTAFINSTIASDGVEPLYMRIKRVGDFWTQSYSTDGTNFSVSTSFTYALQLTAIGPYAGNAGGNPAHIAKIDYFMNVDNPIATEDGCTAQEPPVLASIGNQFVEEDNNLSLTLTATDTDGNDADIVFTETGLPSFASLTDNNDGTASLNINPQLGDEGTYTMTVTVTDSDNLTDEEEFDIFVSIEGTGASSIVSDDFCDGTLDTAVWTFVDPLSDGTMDFTGSGTEDALLEISVPAGPEHQLWTSGIQAPHIIQYANDTDFEVELKMESPVNAPQYQEQGILVKQDDYNFLRFEIYSNNSNTKILSAILESATNSFPLNSSISVNETAGALDIALVYMKVKREGNLWTQSYSFDGAAWTVAGSFSHEIAVSGVGLYSGNGTGTNAPAHTASFDYFKNMADPIIDEDGCDICEGITGLVATWNGSISTDWNDANNWTPNVVPSECAEITIPVTTNLPSISSTLSLKYLKLNSGVSLTVPVGISLIIREDLEMLSNADTFSGLVVKGSVSVYGDARYHRYTNAKLNRNDLIAPPLSGQSWTSFLTSDSNNNADILFNDGVAVPNTTYLFGPFEKGTIDDYLLYNYNDNETLLPGKGYRVATNTPSIEGNGEPLIFTGSVVLGSVFREIENDNTGNYPEWNLIGNPYPAYIDVAAFLNHVGSVSGETNLSLLDTPTAAIYGYNADTNGGLWTVTNLAEGPALIAPGQGFFVSSKDPSATLEFTKDMQIVGTANDFILNRTSTNDFIKLKATSANLSSTIAVHFLDNGSSGLDMGYDAAVFGGSVSEFSLYSHLVDDDEGIPMVIQTLNTDAVNNVVIPLNFNANQGQQIAFSLEDYNLPSSIDVYLEDRLSNNFTLLTSASYTFTANTTISGTGRFYIHFTTGSLSIGEHPFSAITIYSNQSNRSIVIDGNLQKATQALVYDLLGRRVLKQELDVALSKNIINANMLSAGIYIVKLQDGNEQLTKKVMMK